MLNTCHHHCHCHGNSWQHQTIPALWQEVRLKGNLGWEKRGTCILAGINQQNSHQQSKFAFVQLFPSSCLPEWKSCSPGICLLLWSGQGFRLPILLPTAGVLVPTGLLGGGSGVILSFSLHQIKNKLKKKEGNLWELGTQLHAICENYPLCSDDGMP